MVNENASFMYNEPSEDHDPAYSINQPKTSFVKRYENSKANSSISVELSIKQNSGIRENEFKQI